MSKTPLSNTSGKLRDVRDCEEIALRHKEYIDLQSEGSVNFTRVDDNRFYISYYRPDHSVAILFFTVYWTRGAVWIGQYVLESSTTTEL